MKVNLNWASTWIGAGVAIANAWLTIDWDNFTWTGNNIMKLVISAMIAVGGYMTTINAKK